MKRRASRTVELTGTSAAHALCALVLVILTLAGCASEVVRRPIELTPMPSSPAVEIKVLADTTVPVGPGYERVIQRGSVWKLVGRSAEGEVYKPVDRAFTVEGAHIHEAYLVLQDDSIVGFYLPVERAFSPASARLNIRIERRQQ